MSAQCVQLGWKKENKHIFETKTRLRLLKNIASDPCSSEKKNPIGYRNHFLSVFMGLYCNNLVKEKQKLMDFW